MIFISPRTLEAMIEALPLAPMNADDREDGLAFLRLQLELAKGPPRIDVAQHPTDACAWLIDGQEYRAPLRSQAMRAFWLAWRDGEVAADGIAPAGTLRNAKGRLVAWLESIGHPDLAIELDRVQVGRLGRLRYWRRRGAPQVVCIE